MSEDRRDPDAEAILARRRRFIALALGGLSCTSGAEEPPDGHTTTGMSSSGTGSEVTGFPEPCLGRPGDGDGDEWGSETTAPQPCLAPPPGDGDGDGTGDGDGDTTSGDGDGDTTSGDGDGDGDGDTTSGDGDGEPMPCLGFAPRD